VADQKDIQISKALISEFLLFCLSGVNHVSILVSTRVLMEIHFGLNKWLRLMDC